MAAADQTIAGTVKSLPRSPVSRPPLPVRFSAGKKGGARHANLRVVGGHGSLGRGHIRAPLEQVGRQTRRNGRRLEIQGAIGQRKFGRSLAQQNRERVFELRALHAQTDVIRLRGVEQGFRFGDVQAAGDAAVVASLGQVESLLLQVDIIFQDDAFLVDEARHDVIFGDVGFDREQHVLVIGDGGLHLRSG